MNKTKKLLFAGLMVAGMSGCATTMDTRSAKAAPQAAPAETQVSRPASYGSMGGYRYRRFTTASAASGA